MYACISVQARERERDRLKGLWRCEQETNTHTQEMPRKDRDRQNTHFDSSAIGFIPGTDSIHLNKLKKETRTNLVKKVILFLKFQFDERICLNLLEASVCSSRSVSLCLAKAVRENVTTTTTTTGNRQCQHEKEERLLTYSC